MNHMLALLLVSVAATSMAGASVIGGAVSLVGPANPGVVLQGPSAQASVVGPDGSAIAAGAAGGVVVAGPTPGGVVTAAVAPGVVAAPAVVAPAVVAAAPALVGAGTVIDGPSGRIVTPGNALGLIAAGGVVLGR